MSTQDNGGAAFPIPLGELLARDEEYHGMTLRDYFAAKAMQSLLLMPVKEMREIYGHQNVSQAAYEQADVMLQVRQQ